MDSDRTNWHDIYQAAVSLLSRREHSRRELESKLLKRFGPGLKEIQAVIQELVEKNWQSDSRFAASYIRYRSQKGIGPIRLRNELLERGIDSYTVEEVMSEAGLDWFELALVVAKRKSTGQVSDVQASNKLFRFMLYRGFESEQIRYAMRLLGGSCSVC